MNINDYLKKKDDKTLLIDVRIPEQFESFHLENAINLPLVEMRKIEQIVQDKNSEIFLYCNTGRQSMIAEELLKGYGYLKVLNIGGIVDLTE